VVGRSLPLCRRPERDAPSRGIGSAAAAIAAGLLHPGPRALARPNRFAATASTAEAGRGDRAPFRTVCTGWPPRAGSEVFRPFLLGLRHGGTSSTTSPPSMLPIDEPLSASPTCCCGRPGLLPRDAAFTPTVPRYEFSASVWDGPSLPQGHTTLPTSPPKDRLPPGLAYLYECGVREFRPRPSTATASTAYRQRDRPDPRPRQLYLFTAPQFRDRVQGPPAASRSWTFCRDGELRRGVRAARARLAAPASVRSGVSFTRAPRGGGGVGGGLNRSPGSRRPTGAGCDRCTSSGLLAIGVYGGVRRPQSSCGTWDSRTAPAPRGRAAENLRADGHGVGAGRRADRPGAHRRAGPRTPPPSCAAPFALYPPPFRPHRPLEPGHFATVRRRRSARPSGSSRTSRASFPCSRPRCCGWPGAISGQRPS